ncbi:MAG: hypothetical protein AB7E81_02535 [Hyphomicrobiaceae bacterium]
MRDEARKRLDRALFMRKLKWGCAAVTVATLITGAFYFKSLDIMVVTTNLVDGTVVYVGPPIGKFKATVAQTNLQVDVKLDDTRLAHLLTPREKSPKLGEHIKIADQVHASGRHTFTWR